MRGALAMLACACACACAKAPDGKATPKASVEANAEASADAGAGPPVEAGGRVPGLPMPQQIPQFVWDAAAVDAAARDGRGR